MDELVVPPVLRLTDFVAPLSATDFKARHWGAGVPWVSQPNPALVRAVKAIEGLGSIEELLKRLTTEVMLFVPKAFRSSVPAKSALDFLNAGFNLYIPAVEVSLPGAKLPFFEVAKDLGLPPWQVSIEAFAGRAGGVSSRHYDHDINFQILLDGEKRWHLEPNAHITNPLEPFHPRRRADGTLGGFREPAHSTSVTMPTAFDPARVTTHRAEAGTVVFLPRGHWHEVDSLAPTWGVNLVLKGVTWARAMARALELRLNESPDFRAYCDKVSYGEAGSPEEERDGEAHFERLRAASFEALQEMNRNEIVLAPLETIYRWTSAKSERAVVSEGGEPHLKFAQLEELVGIVPEMVSCLRQLLEINEPFSWNDALSLGRTLGSTGLHNLLDDLIALGVLVVEPKK